MSFAVLGSVWPNIHITDKECTDKTYPSFWDDINLVFGLKTTPWMASAKSVRGAEAVGTDGPHKRLKR